MIVGSDSVLVQTAVEMADRHPPSRGLGEEHWCLRCWAPWPCVAARHALEVCRAAGLGSAAQAARAAARRMVPHSGAHRRRDDAGLDRRPVRRS
jgi:hypothetical protein